MRMSRLAAGLITVGLVGVSPVALSTSANAAALGSVTTLTLTAPYGGATAYEVGDTLSFSGSVKGSDGTSTPTVGTASLQVYSPSLPTWTTIAADTSPSSLYFSGVTASTNAVYKVVFSGGTSGFGNSANTYTPSESAGVAVQVVRKVDLKTNRLQVIGKVTPNYGKKKVKVLKKVGKKFKKYKTVKTNSKGKFVFNAPRVNKFKFVLVIPGDANYVAYPSNVYTVRVY
jgi:uncharacterized cupredoxin-like copper-binding protein